LARHSGPLLQWASDVSASSGASCPARESLRDCWACSQEHDFLTSPLLRGVCSCSRVAGAGCGSAVARRHRFSSPGCGAISATGRGLQGKAS
jgi:hypothetical protein